MTTGDRNLGERLRHYRLAAGLTLSEVARRSGVSRSYLHQLEAGTSAPTVDRAARLAEALGIPLADVLGEERPLSVVPPALARFARDAQLPPADVAMLGRINYRGRQPASAEAWRVLHAVIQALCSERIPAADDANSPVEHSADV